MAPAPQFISPGDRWFAHLGKRCISAGISQREDLCLDKPEHRDFVEDFDGYKAVCANVNKCMALCDATKGCFAVEMSQVVKRCVLKGTHCLLHENWQGSEDTNLLVVGRLQDQATETLESARVSHCNKSVTSRCPAEWNYYGNPGGYHCLQKLHYQTSESAYRSSNGACRPVSAGPFPYDDCREQCRISGLGHRHKDHHSGLEVLLDASNVVTKAATASAKARLESLTSSMHFGMMNLPGDDSDLSYKYSGILNGPHCTLYLVPSNADNIGVFETSSWRFRYVDISSFSRGQFKYSAGVIYEEVAYFTPYGADHVGVFDLKTERFGRLGISAGSMDCKYSGAIQHGSIAYFVPSSADHIGVHEMATQRFRTISIERKGEVKWKYRGGVLHDGKCYFAPYNADNIGVLDIATERFETIDISHTTTADMKFTDAFVQNDVVFFVPFNANAVGALHKGLYFELVQIPNLAAESYKFWGAIQVGTLTYFVPDEADAVGVFEASTREYTQVDIRSKISMDFKFASGTFFNGILYFSPRNARSIGMLQVGKVNPHLCEQPEAGSHQVGLPSNVIWDAHHRKDQNEHHEEHHAERHGEHHGGHNLHHVWSDHADHGGGEHKNHAEPHEARKKNEEHQSKDVLGGQDDARDGLYDEPRPSWAVGVEEQQAGQIQKMMDALVAVATIGLALYLAELSREKWQGRINEGSLSLLRSTVVATICAVCFFVLRSLFASGDVPFWVQLGPAICFFVVLWFIFQASLLLRTSGQRGDRLDLIEILGYLTSFAGVDAGGVYLRCFDASCMEAAAALVVFQMVLLGLDALAGCVARMHYFPRASHRSTLLAPVALLSVEVLSFGLLGEFGQEMLLNRLGVVQDGVGPGEPTPPFRLVLVLYSLSCVIFVAAQLLERRKAYESHQLAALSGFWSVIRATQWLAKLLGLPDQGFQLLLNVFLTALVAQLLSVEMPDSRSTSTEAPVISSLVKPLGIALGLLWASSIVRSTCVLVLVAVPRQIIFSQVHFTAVWLMLSLLVATAMFCIKVRAARSGYASLSGYRRQGATDLPTYERQGAVDLPPQFVRQGAGDLSDASPSRAWLLNPFSWFDRRTPKSATVAPEVGQAEGNSKVDTPSVDESVSADEDNVEVPSK